MHSRPRERVIHRLARTRANCATKSPDLHDEPARHAHRDADAPARSAHAIPTERSRCRCRGIVVAPRSRLDTRPPAAGGFDSPGTAQQLAAAGGNSARCWPRRHGHRSPCLLVERAHQHPGRPSGRGVGAHDSGRPQGGVHHGTSDPPARGVRAASSAADRCHPRPSSARGPSRCLVGAALVSADVWVDDIAMALMLHSLAHHARDADWEGTVEQDGALALASRRERPAVRMAPRRWGLSDL